MNMIVNWISYGKLIIVLLGTHFSKNDGVIYLGAIFKLTISCKRFSRNANFVSYIFTGT